MSLLTQFYPGPGGGGGGGLITDWSAVIGTATVGGMPTITGVKASGSWASIPYPSSAWKPSNQVDWNYLALTGNTWTIGPTPNAVRSASQFPQSLTSGSGEYALGDFIIGNGVPLQGAWNFPEATQISGVGFGVFLSITSVGAPLCTSLLNCSSYSTSTFAAAYTFPELTTVVNFSNVLERSTSSNTTGSFSMTNTKITAASLNEILVGTRLPTGPLLGAAPTYNLSGGTAAGTSTLTPAAAAKVTALQAYGYTVLLNA